MHICKKNKFIHEDIKATCTSMARKLTALGVLITLCNGLRLYANAQYNLTSGDNSANKTLTLNELEADRRGLIANLGIDHFTDRQIETLLDIVDALMRAPAVEDVHRRREQFVREQFVLARNRWNFPESLTPDALVPLLDVTLKINKLRCGN